MPKSLHIRFKKKVKGFDPDEDPEFSAIGRAIKHLDYLAKVQSWPLLSSFISEDPDAVLDLLDDEDEIEKLLGRELDDDEDLEKAIAKKLGKLKWFKPGDVIPTVQKLADAVEELPHRLPLDPKTSARVVKQLRELKKTLDCLNEKDVPFRFYAEFG